MIDTFKSIGSPYRRLQEIQALVESVVKQNQDILQDMGHATEVTDSYRLLPKEFDKIFHSRKAVQSTGSFGPRGMDEEL